MMTAWADCHYCGSRHAPDPDLMLLSQKVFHIESLEQSDGYICPGCARNVIFTGQAVFNAFHKKGRFVNFLRKIGVFLVLGLIVTPAKGAPE